MKNVVNEERGSGVETPQEIPRPEWLRRLDLFSAQHLGCSATLELAEPGHPLRLEAHELPLEGIDMDSENSDKVEITMEKDGANRIMHTVTGAKKITLQNPDKIEIESADGTRTVVSCRPSA